MARIFKYDSCQQAWAGINEFIFTQEEVLGSAGEGRDGNVSLMYDVIIKIEKPRVDPKFNFARMFNYRIQKWNSLVSNYLDKERLLEIKADIKKRISQGNKPYQLALHFKNNHKNGKDCLISVVFANRKGKGLPILIFHARTVEATKRMLMDFLLVQRIGEYVYGKYNFKMVCYFPCVLLNAEAFTMYHTYNNLYSLIHFDNRAEKLPHLYPPFQQRVLDTLKKFLTIDPMSIGYKSHRRAAKQLQVDGKGIPYSGDNYLYAKDLKLKI